MYHITWRVARRVCVNARALPDHVVLAARALPAFAASERGRLFYWYPVFLGIGIGLYFSLSFEPTMMVAASVGGATALLFAAALRPAFRHFALTLAFVGLGFALACFRTGIVSAPVLPAEIGPAKLSGTVLNLEMRENGVRLLLKPSGFGRLESHDLPAKVRISVRTKGQNPEAGQKVEVLAILRPPPAPVEPGAFDFQRHLFFQQIGAVGFAVGPVSVTQAETDGAFVSRMRNGVTARVAETLSDQPAALAAALLVGDRGRVNDTSLENLRDSGLAHLLAISGLHVGLVAGFLFFLIRGGLACWPAIALTQPIKKYAAIAAAVGAGAYLILAGGSVPTQRAFIVVAISMLAVLLDRQAISLRVVAIAAMVVLVLTPDALVGASFQMSFAAVLGLVAAYETIGEKVIPKRDSGPVRRVMFYMVGILLTTLIASVATAPFAVHHFNRAADYGIVANLAAMPVMAFWVMPAGVMSMILMPVGLEAWPLVVMGWGIEIILRIAETVSGWPGAVRMVPSGPDWAFLLTIAGGLWLTLIRHRVRLVAVIPIVIGFSGSLWAERPDIRISGDGRLTAVRSADGRLILSSHRRLKFTAGQWLRRDGLAAAGHWPEPGVDGDTKLKCDFAGCIWRGSGKSIALPVLAEAVADDCRLADAVLATVPIRQDCGSPAKTAYDFFDLWRYGALSASVTDEGSIVVRTVNGVRGDRPWVWRPTPRRDQYWRQQQ